MLGRAGKAGLAALLLAASTARAEPVSAAPASAASAPQPLPRQVVTGASTRDDGLFASRSSTLARSRAAASDSARLLLDLPGVSVQSAGGVSGLPAIHGLADDRLRTQVDGMDLAAACANHMNPALSYIDPSNVGSVKVYAGITPVSIGGDSIGGSIQVESAVPEFAAAGEAARVKGAVGSFHRSNGRARGGNLSASYATEALNIGLAASTSQQRNLHAARAFKPAVPGAETGAVIPGDEIASSAYEGRNEELRAAWKPGQAHLWQFTLGRQRLGAQGFPNQRMDMTGNRSSQANLRYTGQFDWSRLQGRVWQQDVRHAMDMGPDRYRYGTGMPMLTEATTRGMQVQADIDLDEADLLRLGVERQTYVLYDWWPAVGGAMGPNAFWNIDAGRRLRSGAFAEWQAQWSAAWSTLAGVRADRVVTDAATVQGYDNGLGALWGQEAAGFNDQPKRRSDDLLDLALTARYRASSTATYEIGLARKGRAPNLHQRYVWSTQAMAALMNNTAGDGNGYVGRIDLKPEIAHTLVLTGAWRAEAAEDGELKAAAYVTRVRDFMDARRCDFGQCSAANVAATQGFVLLQYANAPAQLVGLDLSGRRLLLRGAEWGGWGDVNAAFLLGVLRGRNRATGDGLYNFMPDHLKLSLEHRLGGFASTLEVVAVSAKQRVSRVRNEMAAPGHGLAHLRGSYEWAGGRIDLAVENLFDRFHAAPLGGAYLGQGRSMTSAGIPWGTPVPGTGRSVNTALSLWF